MKALEILNEHAISGLLTFSNLRKHLEAIAELEELIKDKSCDGCIYLENRTRYCDCCQDACSRYPTLRGYPDLYTKDK